MLIKIEDLKRDCDQICRDIHGFKDALAQRQVQWRQEGPQPELLLKKHQAQSVELLATHVRSEEE